MNICNRENTSETPQNFIHADNVSESATEVSNAMSGCKNVAANWPERSSTRWHNAATTRKAEKTESYVQKRDIKKVRSYTKIVV